MSALRETQRAFRVALLGGALADAARDVVRDGLAPEARLAIYRHHVVDSLTAVLMDTFPVVCRLVDPRFFAYAADRFIAAHPPITPCLSAYGERFPHFLGAFNPCRHLVYLPDVARLEWAMSRAQQADDAAPLDPRRLAAVPPAALDDLIFRCHPSLTLLRSRWPIDRLWRANQPDADPAATVQLDEAPVHLQIWRRDDEVVFRRLSAGHFTLRDALHRGLTLGAAALRARAADETCDLAAALTELFHDDVLVSFTSDKEESR